VIERHSHCVAAETTAPSDMAFLPGLDGWRTAITAVA
jgi:hypothetical protein